MIIGTGYLALRFTFYILHFTFCILHFTEGMDMRVRPLALVSLAILAALLVSCSGPGATSQAAQPSSAPLQPATASVQLAATPAPPPPTSADVLTRIDGKVDVGGYQLYIMCDGQGSPTVILDAGLGGTHGAWATVQPSVATFTRVCSYDRAGLGDSDPGPTPRTSQQIVKELHALLDNAGVAGPYMLVGHSFGGFNTRLYAGQYPQDVVGLVLVESTQVDQDDRLLAALPQQQPDEDAGLAAYRKELHEDLVQGPEPIAFKTSASQVRAYTSLGALPLIVLSAGQSVFPEFPPDMAAKLDQTWRDLQQSLTHLSSNSKQIIAERSGHCIQCSQPDLVVDAVRQVTEAVRDHKAL